MDAETKGLVERLGDEAAALLLCASDMDAKPWPPMMTEFVSALSVERKHVAACLSEAAATITRLTAERDEARDLLQQAQAVLEVLGFGADEPICVKIRAALTQEARDGQS